MILRLLALLLVVVFLLWLLKRLFSGDEEPDQISQQPKGENMLQCHYCGIHAPESTVVKRNGQCYCSEEHADLDQQ